MSDYRLPAGTHVLVSLSRPVKGWGSVGMAAAFSDTPMDLQEAHGEIWKDRASLLQSVPALVPPGPPVIVLLQLRSPCGCILAGSFFANIERAAHRGELERTVFSVMPRVLSDLFEKLRGHLHSELPRAADAPTPPLVH
jgi:hypothetical protein